VIFLILGAIEWTTVAVAGPALVGAALGIGGFVRGGNADRRAAEAELRSARNQERTVARDEFDSVIAGQRELIAGFRLDLAKCEADKAVQAVQIDKLNERVLELERAMP
jgi:hypothetical protein